GARAEACRHARAGPRKSRARSARRCARIRGASELLGTSVRVTVRSKGLDVKGGAGRPARPTRSAAPPAAPRAPAHGKTFVPSRLSPVRHRSDASVTAAHARDTADRENSRICAWLARCTRGPHFEALSAGFPDRRTDHETDRDVERTARARRGGDGGLRDEGLGQRHVRPETGADG